MCSVRGRSSDPLTVGNVDQAFYRDLDTRVVEQLTFDSGNKYEIWMWQAPEYGNDFVFMTLVDQVELRVYRKIAGSDGELRWTPIYSRRASDGNKMFSPEPFTYAGRSYIFMSQSVRPNKFRSEIWIANIDSAAPLFRRISDNTLAADPHRPRALHHRYRADDLLQPPPPRRWCPSTQGLPLAVVLGRGLSSRPWPVAGRAGVLGTARH